MSEQLVSLDNIIALSQQSIGGNFDMAPVITLTKEINDLEPNGRMVVDMSNEDSRGSVGIQEGDILLIPEKNNSVYVYSEVSREGSVMFSPNQDINYFVNFHGFT